MQRNGVVESWTELQQSEVTRSLHNLCLSAYSTNRDHVLSKRVDGKRYTLDGISKRWSRLPQHVANSPDILPFDNEARETRIHGQSGTSNSVRDTRECQKIFQGKKNGNGIKNIIGKERLEEIRMGGHQ